LNIDLLVFDADVRLLDAFVARRDEIIGKRFSHKRAFKIADVVVELFLVRGGATLFWDSLSYRWPDGGPVDVEGLPVASARHVTAFRRDHASIRSAWHGSEGNG
jgi:hypothetical protein